MREPSKTDYWSLLDEEAETLVRYPAEKKVRSPRPKRTDFDAQMRTMLAEELHKEEQGFKMTYQAARTEQGWLSEALAPFFHDSLISDVLRMVRGGKEANVYCCRAHPALDLTPGPFPAREGEIRMAGFREHDSEPGMPGSTPNRLPGREGEIRNAGFREHDSESGMPGSSPNRLPGREGEIRMTGFREHDSEPGMPGSTPPSLAGKGDGGIGLLAAKIYRPLNRNMKNDAVYREGRVYLGDDGKSLLNHREARAIQQKTRKGKEMKVTSWIEYEFQTMEMLYAAGSNVPRPVAQNGNAILMEYLGELTEPAPILQSVVLDPAEARELFDILMHDVEIMLAHHRIHADLSAYNVLYWEGEVTIIDFPQVVDPILNSRGYALLARDIHRLCQYFIRQGVRANASQIATDMWGRYIRGEYNKR